MGAYNYCLRTVPIPTTKWISVADGIPAITVHPGSYKKLAPLELRGKKQEPSEN